MKTERTKDMPILKRKAIAMVWNDIQKIKHDGRWNVYEAELKHENDSYAVKCNVSFDGQIFLYKNLSIAKNMKAIYLNPKDYH